MKQLHLVVKDYTFCQCYASERGEVSWLDIIDLYRKFKEHDLYARLYFKLGEDW